MRIAIHITSRKLENPSSFFHSVLFRSNSLDHVPGVSYFNSNGSHHLAKVAGKFLYESLSSNIQINPDLRICSVMPKNGKSNDLVLSRVPSVVL